MAVINQSINHSSFFYHRHQRILYISSHPTGIVELHKHGKIWAESEGEGYGCTFFVHLPLLSLHYVAPTGFTKRGSLKLPSSSMFTLNTPPMTPMKTSTRTKVSRKRTNASTTTIDNGKSEQDHHDVSVSSEGSENDSNDGTDTDLKNERRASMVPSLASPKGSAMDAWKPTVLVVDDSNMNRKMLVRMLISNGFACREAEDGMEGLSEMSRLIVPSASVTRMSFNMFSGTLFNVISYFLYHPLSYFLLYLMCTAFMSSSTGMLSHHHTPRDPVEVLSKPKAHSYTFMRQIEEQLVEKQPHDFAIDAVLIDFNMPRMNGPDAIMEMRKMGFRGPIIGVSGGEEETMTQFLHAGADDVLQKPAKTDDLVNMLLRGLEQVIRDETSGTSTQNTSGECKDKYDGKSTGGSDDGTNTTNKSVGGSDDGADNPTPISGFKSAQRIAQLRQFLVEALATTAKKRTLSSSTSSTP